MDDVSPQPVAAHALPHGHTSGLKMPGCAGGWSHCRSRLSDLGRCS